MFAIHVRSLLVFTVITLGFGCGGSVDDLLEEALRGKGHSPPTMVGTGHAPLTCAKEVPPSPHGGQCPAAGTSCPGSLPTLLPCRQAGVDAVAACAGPAERRTWRLDVVACSCADHLPPPPPPGTGACPIAGTTCPGTLPGVLPCLFENRRAIFTCEGPAGDQRWRLDLLQCG